MSRRRGVLVGIGKDYKYPLVLAVSGGGGGSSPIPLVQIKTKISNRTLLTKLKAI